MSTDDEKLDRQRQQGRRLRQARVHMQFDSATKFAEFLKEPYNTYASHENGNRGMGKAAERYAAKIGVPEEWLLRGRNPPDWAVEEQEPTVEDGDGGQPAHFLPDWRIHAKLTADDLADKIGATLEQIATWERGAEIPQKWLRKLADAIGTTQGAILDVDPSSVPPAVLEVWLNTTKQQQVVRRQLMQIARTGTDD